MAYKINIGYPRTYYIFYTGTLCNNAGCRICIHFFDAMNIFTVIISPLGFMP